MPAYARYPLAAFADTDPAAVLGRLSAGYAAAGYAAPSNEATAAWAEQVRYLRTVARQLVTASAAARGWGLLLEYPIPRRAKRIDAVLLAADVVLVLEFKTGRRPLTAADRRQVEDYALDLRDFHAATRGRVVVPVLVAPNLPAGADLPAPLADEPAQRVHALTGEPTADEWAALAARFHRPAATPIDPAGWDAGAYRPVPTIIEAARHLYATHSVREITRAHAGGRSLAATTAAVLRVVDETRRAGRKAVCFVTGVPGAGKTLTGLNVVHGEDLHRGRETLGVFLSGNGPLVRVLTEALAEDRADRRGESTAVARRTVTTFLQNVHHFLAAHAGPDAPAPPDNVVVFDEAQRAWDRAQSFRKFKREKSEPELMFEIMDRRPWAVIVALVGNGQEINTGEAGLPEWGRALAGRFPHWHAHAAPGFVDPRAGGPFAPLFPGGAGPVAVHRDAALHLSVSLRSFRAEALSGWVDAVLGGRPADARRLRADMPAYPLALTRSLDAARDWLRGNARGERRAGLVASSGGRRLRAHGLDVTAELDEPAWFLRPKGDVRSSSFLELVATEFAVQGLELDWTGVCWDADLGRSDGGWAYRTFSGTRWQRVKDPGRRAFAVNKYRVLLTRGREGMVVWVPPGAPADDTRPHAFYDETAAYLTACGADPV